MTAENPSVPGASTEEMENLCTEEQKEFLKLCEETFQDRYTESDSEFQAFLKKSPKPPPIIDPWHIKPRRNFDQRGRYAAHGWGPRDRRDNEWRSRNDNRAYQQRYGDKFYYPRHRPY